MPLTIKPLEKVYCSLNIGFIYNISFDFSPDAGSKITVTFVNDTGDYDTSFLSAIVPASIGIGQAKFQMYPIAYDYQMNNTRKVISVTFVDDFHKLNNFYIVLGERGCGTNTFSLGVPITDLTEEFKMTPQEIQIRDLTTIFDLEYAFGDFIEVLRGIFPVEVSAGATNIASQTAAGAGENILPNIITRNFTGSFREVLDAWCSFLDLFYFIENGTIKIFASADLNLQFPDPPNDALAFNRTESLENTYSKTASLYFEDEGGETSVPNLIDVGGAATIDQAQAANAANEQNSLISGNNYLTVLTLFGYNTNFAFNSLGHPSAEPDIQQCIAASYGEAFWFLYNFYNSLNSVPVKLGVSLNPDGSLNDATSFNGTYLSEIGLTIVQAADLPISNGRTASALGAIGACRLDREVFSSNFNKFRQYGREKAGRFYMTYPQNNVDYYDQFTFVFTSGVIREINGQDFINERVAKLEKFVSPIGTQPDSFDPITGILPNSEVPGFEGLPVVGNRMFLFDNTQIDYDAIFALTGEEEQSLDSRFSAIINGISASDNFQFDFLGGGEWVLFPFTQSPGFLGNKINQFLVEKPAFFPRFGGAIGVTGYTKINNLNIAGTNNIADGNKRISKKGQVSGTDNGINFTGNTEINNPRQSSSQNIQVSSANQTTTITSFGGIRQKTLNPFAYFSKLQKCSSLSQGIGANVLNHRFEAKQISVNTPLKVVLAIQGRLYIVSRDTTFIDDSRWQAILNMISSPRTFTDKSLTFSTNYFYNVPADFLSNGLTSMSVEVSEAGLTATYTFSNRMMIVPNYESQEAKIERAIKQSAISQYNIFARFNNLATI